MAKTERNWHHDFILYMESIVNHPNYRGLLIERKRDGSLAWIASAKSEVGKRRIEWAKNKARELGYPIEPGVYARVMLEIHPTKQKVCQICGSVMSLYYHYPSVNFLKTIERRFGLTFTECDHICDIWEQLIESGVSDVAVRSFIDTKFGVDTSTSMPRDEVISLCEHECRVNGKKLLSPGAMSNFPDRYDGFHTYNRCCRANQDKGRSRENLKSYVKDRRAYEYWSDGNLHAADMFMGSSFFDDMSADHIGPISLGFVHDPCYLRPMTSSNNSTKRDRLLSEDIDEIIAVANRTGVYPMSWYSARIWEFIKSNYRKYPDLVATHYRDMLKQNMADFMYILRVIVDKTGVQGEDFLYKEFIAPKADDFEHTYKFQEDGTFSKTPRHKTERSVNEFERFKRIALVSVDEYGEKTNRHIYSDLSKMEINELDHLCDLIKLGVNGQDCRERLEGLIIDIQERLINNVTVLYMQ